MSAHHNIDLRIEAQFLSIPIGLVQDLSAARTKNESLNVFAFWCGRIVQAERCSVAMPEGENLVVTGLSGNQIIGNRSVVPIEGSFLGEVFINERADIQTDLRNQTSLNAKTLADAGIKTVMIAPLLAGGRCLGTLAFGFASECAEDRDRLEVIKALAQCLGTQLLLLEQIDELKMLVQTDSLTGTFNRRHLDTISPVIWDAWAADDISFAVVTVDIDHFKSVNDAHGHAVGDEVLRVVAARLRRCVRPEDTVIRLGGEEFVLILRNCSLKKAQKISERAHEAISTRVIQALGLELPITVSVGVSVVTGQDGAFEESCERSDQALYAAKDKGRNCVVIH